MMKNRKTTQNIIKDKEISWNTTKYHERRQKILKDDKRSWKKMKNRERCIETEVSSDTWFY